jgi:hypothetical protein
VHVKPVDGDIEATRLTVPVNPLREEMVIADEDDVLALTVTLEGLALKVKSGCRTVTVIVVVRENEPIEAVTVTA